MKTYQEHEDELVKLKDELSKLRKQFDQAALLIDALYTSGCLDLEREELVQKWLRGAVHG